VAPQALIRGEELEITNGAAAKVREEEEERKREEERGPPCLGGPVMPIRLA
jgi:hypothetical protein